MAPPVTQRTMAGLILLLNGFPGVGKLAIGRLLAKSLGLRLLDNHALLNPAEILFDRDDPLYWPLRSGVRKLVLDHLARQSKPLRLLLTDALAADVAPDQARFDDIRELARARSARLVTVVLQCGLEENARRLVSVGRREHHKLTDVGVLQWLHARGALLRPRQGETIELEITRMTAAEAALAIERKVHPPD